MYVYVCIYIYVHVCMYLCVAILAQAILAQGMCQVFGKSGCIILYSLFAAALQFSLNFLGHCVGAYTGGVGVEIRFVSGAELQRWGGRPKSSPGWANGCANHSCQGLRRLSGHVPYAMRRTILLAARVAKVANSSHLIWSWKLPATRPNCMRLRMGLG